VSLQKELGFMHPFENPEHEALLDVVYTGLVLQKEGYQILRPYGLTDSQFNVLMLLKYQTKDGTINQTRLGDMLLVNRSNVTGLIDRLEKSGWVERVADPVDRRVKLLTLTPAGDEILQKAEKTYTAEVIQAMSSFSAQERAMLSSLLEKIRAGLQPSQGDKKQEDLSPIPS
jgi:DNA-binding MarR family transcriptional regulator